MCNKGEYKTKKLSIQILVTIIITPVNPSRGRALKNNFFFTCTLHHNHFKINYTLHPLM